MYASHWVFETYRRNESEDPACWIEVRSSRFSCLELPSIRAAGASPARPMVWSWFLVDCASPGWSMSVHVETRKMVNYACVG